MAEGKFQDSPRKKRLFVAAIDLGTTYSGWAYSSLSEPDKVYANHVWYSDIGTLGSLKTPTCVLLTSRKEFECFGYEAQSRFATLAEEHNHSGWYFFRRFKMALFDDSKLTRHTMIEDISGKKMSALVIFAHAIRYLKDNFMQTIRNAVNNVKDTDITFVLTVPAIWNDMAKRFMREAAIEAGIPDDQLIIALEPEAASIWCQRIHTEVHRNSGAAELGICGVGTRYMIVDLGGGTADITVHEKRPNNTLLEIHKPSGGPWGGTEVDKTFIQLLENVLGPSAWKKYEREEVEDILDIYTTFETKKRTMKLANSGHEMIKVPSSFRETFGKNSTTETLERKFNNKIEWNKDKIKVDSELLKTCFDEPLNQVIEHIQNILTQRSMKNVNKIMLVGGFAESPYVQDMFRATFENEKKSKQVKVIIPPECGLAVLKGAVLFGHDPSIVTARIARYTYGLEIAVPFECTKHSREKLVSSDSGPLCKDSFWKAVEVGQEIKSGHEVSRIGKAVDDFQPKMILKVVKSKQPNPVYTTDEGCEVIGQVVVPMDSTLNADKNAVDELFIFGGTELILKTRHRTTGSEQTLSFNL